MATTRPLTFHKYHGAGNDFIMVDNRDGHFDQYSSNSKFTQWMCDRRFGVGADGIVELRKHPEYDFEMVYTREEGIKGPYLCGNGSRCIVAFAHSLQVDRDGDVYNFLATDGPHKGWVDESTGKVCVTIKSIDEIKKYDDKNYFIDVGNERHVTFVKNLWEYDVMSIGRRISHDPQYEASGGMNVMFVQVETNSHLSARSFESKIDYEPLACGTGAVASALVYESRKPWETSGTQGVQRTEVTYTGGEVTVSFQRTGPTSFRKVILIGPAIRVFEGRVTYEAYLAHPESKYSLE